MSSRTSIGRIEEWTADVKPLVAHFLLQVQIAHVRSPHCEPAPLHFDSVTQTMVQYFWPVDPANGERIAPSEFESHRRTHELRAPCCLCAFVEETDYTESRIGVAETVTQDLTRNQSVLNGEIVAVCAKQRCGYFLCLERFYNLRGLKSRTCRKRDISLAPEAVSLPRVGVKDSFRGGDGLFQVMTDAVVRGRRGSGLQMVKPRKEVRQSVVRALAQGISEQQFWATFVQCLVCREVTFRDTFGANHVCDVKQSSNVSPPRIPNRRFSPYATPCLATGTTRSRVAASRLQRTYALALVPTSPALTVLTDAEGGDVSPDDASQYGVAESGDLWESGSDTDRESAAKEEEEELRSEPELDNASDADSEFEVFGSDDDVPSITQIFEQWRREKRAARGSLD